MGLDYFCPICKVNYIHKEDDICLSCAEFDWEMAESIEEFSDLEKIKKEDIERLQTGSKDIKVILTQDTQIKNNL